MNSDKAEEYKVYSSRWLMLGLFCVLNMSNAVLWVTFAPITDISSDYFGGASTTSINMLALIFQIVYAPGTLVGVLATKKYGLRDTLIFGGVLNTLGALIRYIATLCRTQAGSWGAYTLMMVGQFCGALAQPIYVNLPATMAADWFAVDERDIATTIAALFNPLGAAIGQVLPPMLVTQSEDDDNGYVHGMSSLMLAETIVCLVPLLLAVVWFKSKPPTPPSRSAKLKDSLLEEEVEHQHHIHDHSATSLPPTLPISKSSNTIDSVPLSDAHRNSIGEPVRKLSMAEDGVAFSSADLEAVKLEFESLMANKDYVILLVAFSIGLGMFNAYLTLIYQIIEPHGYSNDDAGNFAAVLILFGLIGAGITGAILDATHLYRQVLKLGFISCTLALMFFSCMLYSNNTIMMYVSFGLLGLFMLPMLPAVVENCAECTYPIQEDLSVGLLFIGMYHGWYCSFFNIFICMCAIFICVLIFASFSYRRKYCWYTLCIDFTVFGNFKIMGTSTLLNL